MNPDRFKAITRRYPDLALAVVGDFCLDRYLEIDPAKQEISLETGLVVHNVVRVRGQPGGAGTILNNLAALGIGTLYPVGFAGQDGEGMELTQALQELGGTCLEHFLSTPLRRTFTYCKPLLLHQGRPPEELNRLDSKNWAPTPDSVQDRIIKSLRTLADQVHAVILLAQTDQEDTGVLTSRALETVRELIAENPTRLFVADSRQGLRGYPPVCHKMNRSELAALTGMAAQSSVLQIQNAASGLARKGGHPVVVTLAQEGMVGALPNGELYHLPAWPVRGPIDIVGAGDAVTAHLTAALAAGGTWEEALALANAASSVVIHQLGTTGVAPVTQLAELLFP